MSLFSKILAKVFPSDHPAVAAPAPAATAPASIPSVTPPVTPPPVALAPVDVEAVLKGLAEKHPGPANWRTSIVDLLKLLQLDSDLESRKGLARELGYTGDTGDSAAMNVWLHKEVMAKLAINGGKVPAELLT